MIILSKRFNLYFHTLRYLTIRQIYYQVIHRLKKTFLKQLPSEVILSIEPRLLNLSPSIPSKKSYLGNRTFIFLNKEKVFEKKIDWDFIGFEKLWIYNLNYFDFLLQDEITKNDSVQLLDEFCVNFTQRKEGIEPYPISLRGMNWIKFFTYHQINNTKYNSVLYAHYRHLANNLEYHLLGNHLLENGFSLLYGSYYFKDINFYKKSKRILTNELEEQILNDGAHFELSPMYHQIMLWRLLDCFNLVKNNFWIQDDLIMLLESCAQKMLGWLDAVTFTNGDIPMVNDSAYDIAPNSVELLQYGERLGLVKKENSLSDSGYRMIRKPCFELFLDVGNIGPDYIPGHAHSDTFNYILYVKNKPLVVDVGTTTYEKCDKRILERSTCSHNTVSINNHNQSEVWASFRVGRRAKVVDLVEDENKICASHNGYDKLGATHNRSWQWTENELVVTDTVDQSKHLETKAYMYFYPGVELNILNDVVYVGDSKISFIGQYKLVKVPYEFSYGFYRTRIGFSLQIDFQNSLITRFEFTE